MKKSYTIAIADTQRIVTGGLKHLLTKSEDMTVMACFGTGASVLQYEQFDQIDVMLLDVFLPDSPGAEICLQLKKLYPKLIVLGIGSKADPVIVNQMICSGASGYLLKTAAIEAFYKCIPLSTMQSPVYCDEVQKVMDAFSAEDFQSLPKITRREREVLLLLIEGKKTRDISELLFISYLTVQTHRRNLLCKFKAKNVVALINFVKANNLL